MQERTKLTTEGGAPVPDNQHSQTAGPADKQYGERLADAVARAKAQGRL